MSSVTDKFDVDFCGEEEEYGDASVAKFVLFFSFKIENCCALYCIKSSLFLKMTFSAKEHLVTFNNNSLRRRKKRVTLWNDNVTMGAQPLRIDMTGRDMPNYKCVRIGNYERKRKALPQEGRYPTSPDNHKPWVRTMNSAEYKHAKLSNGSTLRVYTNPGSYVSMDAKHFKIQRA